MRTHRRSKQRPPWWLAGLVAVGAAGLLATTAATAGPTQGVAIAPAVVLALGAIHEPTVSVHDEAQPSHGIVVAPEQEVVGQNGLAPTTTIVSTQWSSEAEASSGVSGASGATSSQQNSSSTAEPQVTPTTDSPGENNQDTTTTTAPET